MSDFFKNNWILLSFSTIVMSLTFYITTKKPIKEDLQPENITSPRVDSIIAAADTIVKILEIQKKKQLELQKEKELVIKELKKEKKKVKKQPKEKTKIVVETKEVVVEKKVLLQDPSVKDMVVENYKIQEENKYLKEELDCLKKNSLQKPQSRKDTISTDTIRRKKRKFIFF